MKNVLKNRSLNHHAIDFDVLPIGDAFVLVDDVNAAIVRIKISDKTYICVPDTPPMIAHDFRVVFGTEKILPYRIESVTLRGYGQ
jgi:hypothetical protein